MLPHRRPSSTRPTAHVTSALLSYWYSAPSPGGGHATGSYPELPEWEKEGTGKSAAACCSFVAKWLLPTSDEVHPSAHATHVHLCDMRLVATVLYGGSEEAALLMACIGNP
jgi:hypothetical protein